MRWGYLLWVVGAVLFGSWSFGALWTYYLEQEDRRRTCVQGPVPHNHAELTKQVSSTSPSSCLSPEEELELKERVESSVDPNERLHNDADREPRPMIISIKEPVTLKNDETCCVKHPLYLATSQEEILSIGKSISLPPAITNVTTRTTANELVSSAIENAVVRTIASQLVSSAIENAVIQTTASQLVSSAIENAVSRTMAKQVASSVLENAPVCTKSKNEGGIGTTEQSKVQRSESFVCNNSSTVTKSSDGTPHSEAANTDECVIKKKEVIRNTTSEQLATSDDSGSFASSDNVNKAVVNTIELITTNSSSSSSEETVDYEAMGLLPVKKPLCLEAVRTRKQLTLSLDCACQCNWCNVHVRNLPASNVSSCVLRKKENDLLDDDFHFLLNGTCTKSKKRQTKKASKQLSLYGQSHQIASNQIPRQEASMNFHSLSKDTGYGKDKSKQNTPVSLQHTSQTVKQPRKSYAAMAKEATTPKSQSHVSTSTQIRAPSKDLGTVQASYSAVVKSLKANPSQDEVRSTRYTAMPQDRQQGSTLTTKYMGKGNTLDQQTPKRSNGNKKSKSGQKWSQRQKKQFKTRKDVAAKK